MRLLIIDDDPFVSLSLKTILSAEEGIEVEGIGKSGEEAVTLYREYRPDILLMDIQMEGKGGLWAGREILKEDPEAKILYLTTFSDSEYIIEALKRGARGYLIKQEIDSIPPALQAVMSGQSVFGNEIVHRLPSLLSSQGADSHRDGAQREERSFLPPGNTETADSSLAEGWGLTDKEFEIVSLVAEGLNNREIARHLCLGEGTVRNYLSIILEKLNLRDRTQLAVFYYRRQRER